MPAWKSRASGSCSPMSDLEEAAIEYVAARLANEQAGNSEWVEALSRVDTAWHSLVELSGLSLTPIRSSP